MSRSPERKPLRPKYVRGWKWFVQGAAKREYLKIRDDDLVLLSALLTIYGEPGTKEGTRGYRALRALLLASRTTPDRRYKRPTNLAKALRVIPPNRDAIGRIVEAVEAYQEARDRPLSKERFRPDEVIPVILAVPDPRPYVEVVVDELDSPRFGAVFHPNTLAYQRKSSKLRGVFGQDGEGSRSYWDKVRRQLSDR